jgi:hypothetical protein
MPNLPPWVFTFLSAELFFLLVRSEGLKNLVKRPQQRTAEEQENVTHGLRRSLLLECVLFVPASATLLLFIAPAALPSLSVSMPAARLNGFYSMMGLVSYGFPFATVRTLVTRVALNTLKEFANINRPPGDDKHG